ncbi:MAG: hypothetical protein V4509_01720 [Patescibacteria group bacterium]
MSENNQREMIDKLVKFVEGMIPVLENLKKLNIMTIELEKRIEDLENEQN